jgi:hypothetical protein
MNPHSRLVAILNRIAAATGVLRTRSDDAIRAKHNGTDAEIQARVERAITKLEHVARELEDALA